jgi:phage shock protein A
LAKVLESNVNAILDRAEDPAKILDQAILDMKSGREDARRSLIEAKTAQRLALRRREKALNEAIQLESRALESLERGEEEQAHSWVDLKLAAEDRAEAEASASEEHQAQIEQLQIAERELARRLRELPARRATLLARQATAEARGASSSKGFHGNDSVSHAMEAFERMESKIIASEVEAEVCSADMQWSLGSTAYSSQRTQDALAGLKSQSQKQISSTSGVLGAKIPVANEPDSLEKLKHQLGEN